MQSNIPTTAEILAIRKLGRSVDSRWAEWAISMLENGCNAPSLRILAGETALFNKFEMEELVDRTLDELGLTQHQSHVEAARAYTSVLVQQLLDGRASIDAVLSELTHLCIELGRLQDIYEFYLLHYARKDLQHYETQHYWLGANRQNIDQIIDERCKTWLIANPISD